jgi:hypothetical protein
MTETTETARALLYRHGLPEDIVDGALCLHAQELAAAIRKETLRLKAHGVLEPDKYRPCRDAANQIDPTRSEDDGGPEPAAVPAPATDRAALREALRRAVCEAEGFAWDSDMLEPDEYGDHADAVLAVLPASPDQADEAANLRTMYDAVSAREHELIEERDELIRQRDQIAMDTIKAFAAEPTDRAAFVAEAVAELEAVRDKTDVNVAVYPRYDARQRSALNDGISRLRRMADETPQPETEAQWSRTGGFDQHDDYRTTAPAVVAQPDGEAEDAVAPHCDGFPTTCPNPITVPPAPPHHGGGIRCGCFDEEPS